MAIAVAHITICDQREFEVSSVAPSNPVVDMLWLDTSVTPNLEKRWNGTSWVIINEVTSSHPVITSLSSSINQNAGDISMIVSEVWSNGTQNASRIDMNTDKIVWAIQGDGAQSEFSFTQDALKYMGRNVDMTLNNGFNITIHGLQEGVQSALDTIENDIEPTIGNVNAWMNFTSEGLRQGKEGSEYSTLIDNEGYHIDKTTVVGSHVASFTADGVKTGGIHIGNLIVKPTATGGWAWTEA